MLKGIRQRALEFGLRRRPVNSTVSATTASVSVPGLGELTECEHKLVEAARNGNWLVCSDLAVGDLTDDEDLRYCIRAGLVRELLMERRGALDPHGIRLRRARIVGTLDLEDLQTTSALRLVECVIPEPINAMRATLLLLDLRRSVLSTMHADGLRVKADMLLEGMKAEGASEQGTIQLVDAQIGGQLNCDDAEVSNADGPALCADRLRVDASLFLRRLKAHGAGDEGTIRLLNAHIGSQFSCREAEISNASGPALIANDLRVDSGLIMRSVKVEGASRSAAISLLGASIAGQFTCMDAEITNADGPALNADYSRVDADFLLRDAKASGASKVGTIRLLGAHIGQLDCDGAEIANPDGPALDVERLRVDSSVFLRRTIASGYGELGTINLLDAHFGGQFTCADAKIISASGPALRANSLRVDGNVFLTRVKASGDDERGVISLVNAHVDGQLDCEGAEVANTNGPAINADGLRVGAAFLMRKLKASGVGPRATIRLLGAHVGQFDGDSAEIVNTDGPAMNLGGLRVDASLFLRRTKTSGTGQHATIRLLGAQIGGEFSCGDMQVDNPDGLVLDVEKAHVALKVLFPPTVVCPEPDQDGPCPHPRRLNLDHFTFDALGSANWKQWLHLTRWHTPNYRPQPYQQLATVERAAGHDGNARQILVAQQDDLRLRQPDALGGWGACLVHQLWGALAGYGYRARNTAAALLIALVAAGALGFVAGQVDTRPGHHAAERTIAGGQAGTACSSVELVGLGLDRGLPLGPTGLRARCDLDTATRWGQGFTILIWIIQAALWGLATLALAGYTNLIRKTG